MRRKASAAVGARPGRSPRPSGTAALAQLLERHRRGAVTTAEAVEVLRHLPFRDLGFARVDTHRHLRRGFPEVVLGAGKTAEQVTAIAAELTRTGAPVLITRTTREVFELLRAAHPRAVFHEAARAVTIARGRIPRTGRGRVLVVSAGTSDHPVAEEAAVTSEVMGNRTDRLYDVGVAGIHRLMNNRERLTRARVIVVCAGMEGALPSAVGGLVSCPVIAVPTSVGYGASFGGLAALLGMLNSCAAGVAVMNIDNGFGAAHQASQINRLVAKIR